MNFEALRQTLNALQVQAKSVDVFFRDDDADRDIPALWRLLHTFLLRGVPLNLEIIPGSLTLAATRLLQLHKQTYPHLLELNQHGWMHSNHETEGRKCEFGVSRNFAAQYADIAQGKAKMDEAFGRNWHAVFTPPWNRCTLDTLQVLQQLGFKIFSKDRGVQLTTGYDFVEISTTLDLFQWQPKPAMKTPAVIERELIRQLQQGEPIGILLHHKVMDTAAFNYLSALLDELRRSPVVRFHTFESLLAGNARGSRAEVNAAYALR